MKIKANQLSPHLQKNLARCYLVTGDEHLLVDECLDAIRSHARDRGFTSRDLHVATTGFDWSQLSNAGSNLSLFAERRVVEKMPGHDSRRYFPRRRAWRYWGGAADRFP